MSTTCGCAAGRAGGAEPQGAARQSRRRRRSGGGSEVGEERREGLGVQEWSDGSRYEGEFVNGFKHGKGRYSWSSGEVYEGSFYKDYRHGDGLYLWPTGHKFTGKFYLNRKEGYGQHVFPDGATFQGLYRSDQRFGPGVFTYPDGHQDVGLWLGERLLKLCTCVEEGFSLTSLPEYAAYMGPPDSLTHSEVDLDGDLPSDFILPPGMGRYSTDGDHLPIPPGHRRALDQHFFGELWQPDANSYQGYKRDPLSTQLLQARMQAHIHKHRLQAENVGWDVAAVLCLNRQGFGPKGPLEVSSELLIQHSFRGDLQAVSQILQTRSVHPDVADLRGHTALIAATVNCQNNVIQLLLDEGADIDQLNCEGMSALAVCHVLYYPFQSLHTALTEPPAKTAVVLRSPSSSENSPQISQVKGAEGEDAVSRQTESRPGSVEDMEGRQTEDQPCVERSIQVLDGHIPVGCVQWKQVRAKDKNKEPSLKQNFDSTCSVSSFTIQVTEEAMLHSAEALSRTGFPQHADTEGTVRKMAAMKIERRVRLNTLKLLLERGADPNVSRVPIPVLFLAIMASDTEAVRRLLLCGARTDISLPPEKKGLHPLHVAAALLGPAGPTITEMLLHSITDPDARACDQDDIYEPDMVCTKVNEPLSTSEIPHLGEGGRTALHVACQKDADYLNSSKVVALLLSHSARTDLIWSGHSPLSLAIASGNDMAVEELLKGGADPNIPLGCRVGSALCAIANINYHLGDRIKLLGMLAEAGADILMPVRVGDIMGTAVDYAHYSFQQDLRISETPFHALNMAERETFKARSQLLRNMAELVRWTARQKEREILERELTVNSALMNLEAGGANRCEFLLEKAQKHSKPAIKFCYHCGRCTSVQLTACSRCHKVFYCSRSCKLKGWDEGHREECMRPLAHSNGLQKKFVVKPYRGPEPLPAMLKPRSPLSVEPQCTTETILMIDDKVKENYSFN
ncbi:ankyrin repeat and MYND domain-containing protein 1 [Parambassis ranga]|uniref:Ankyrin repeat and MYND domain-containing protein 1 n=1 Tax=Parambassis ranga TaxID=210632 RepID=A0A6P7HVL7_9TELE|nr:ankyrin repeat and MYND domain-containing protein 1-like [Parambassis ranga]